MMHRKKHLKHKKIDSRRLAAIIALILVSILFVGSCIAILSYKGYVEQKPNSTQQPMTMGVVLLDRNTLEPVTESAVAPTIKPTTSNPTKTVETSAPTQAPTESPTTGKTSINFDEDSTEYLVYDAPENNPDGINLRFTGHHLLEIDNPDHSYAPQPIHLDDSERKLAAEIIMREFGEGGYIACCLQAQALRDAMIFSYASLEQVYHYFQYDKYSDEQTPNKDCYDAIDYIFDLGGLAVPHRILYMYNPSIAKSDWHESQEFVVKYNGVKYFDYKE